MSRFVLKGDFSTREITSQSVGDQTEVCIPFLSGAGELKYGIGQAFWDLQNLNIYPTEGGFDLLNLATLVYLADTRISRYFHAQDGWTREIKIELPVFDVDTWSGVNRIFSQMLNFLTGDIWEIEFSKRDVALSCEGENKASFDAVSLFSGGMDSLIGVINHLEQQHHIALISHAGDSFTKSTQSELLKSFEKQYPELNPASLNLWQVFENDIISDGGRENTTRSRSFLFFAFGLFALTGMNGVSVLEVPENALIALNVPLDDLRVGSHSTRTTHPYYMNLWNEVLSGLGLSLSVKNPYWNKTKGEMAVECLNKDFLLEIIDISISCSSPSKSRWEGLPPQHCGYCVPCLIRRAAIHGAFGFKNDPTTYTVRSIRDIFESHGQTKGAQLRSFQYAIHKIVKNPRLKDLYIHKSGRLDGDAAYLGQLADVYQRGLIEVDDFIRAVTELDEDA